MVFWPLLSELVWIFFKIQVIEEFRKFLIHSHNSAGTWLYQNREDSNDDGNINVKLKITVHLLNSILYIA